MPHSAAEQVRMLYTSRKVPMIRMEIIYDPETHSVDIEFQKGKYEISQEIAEGVIIDYTKDGKIIPIEILNASQRMPMEDIRGITGKLPLKAG